MDAAKSMLEIITHLNKTKHNVVDYLIVNETIEGEKLENLLSTS